LFRNQFGRFGSHIGKGSVRRRLITTELCDYAFAPAPRKRNDIFKAASDRKSTEGA
jgi:hypothetical protein